MSTDVNVGFLSKLHEEDGSSIVDGGHLPYRIEVDQHDVCKASQIRREGSYVKAFSFPSTTNTGLYHFYRDHPILERSEVIMI